MTTKMKRAFEHIYDNIGLGEKHCENIAMKDKYDISLESRNLISTSDDLYQY
jgi:hypothetical protein